MRSPFKSIFPAIGGRAKHFRFGPRSRRGAGGNYESRSALVTPPFPCCRRHWRRRGGAARRNPGGPAVARRREIRALQPDQHPRQNHAEGLFQGGQGAARKAAAHRPPQRYPQHPDPTLDRPTAIGGSCPWHRAYLGYFEQTSAAVLGPGGFRLPLLELDHPAAAAGLLLRPRQSARPTSSLFTKSYRHLQGGLPEAGRRLLRGAQAGPADPAHRPRARDPGSALGAARSGEWRRLRAGLECPLPHQGQAVFRGAAQRLLGQLQQHPHRGVGADHQVRADARPPSCLSAAASSPSTARAPPRACWRASRTTGCTTASAASWAPSCRRSTRSSSCTTRTSKGCGWCGPPGRSGCTSRPCRKAPTG